MREASSRRPGCGTSIESRPRSRPPRPFAPHHVARRVLKAPALFAVARLLPQRPSEFLGFRDRRAWRPYRAWGYPITFLIFLTVAGLMMYYLVTNRPVQSLAGFGMMIAGLAVYYASRLQDVLRPRVTRMLRKAGVAAVVASAIIPAAAYSARAQTASADDTARFLGGMPPSSASPLAPLTQDPAWQQHARYFNSAFGNLDKNQ